VKGTEQSLREESNPLAYPAVFSRTFIVPESAIDENGHVNNVACVQWKQDAAAILHYWDL